MKRGEFRTYISGDARFDDERYWRFARRLDGPLHVERSWLETVEAHADIAVVAAALLCLVVALVVAR